MRSRLIHVLHVIALRLVAVAVLAFASSACSKPEPPVITPKEAGVVGVTATGVEMRAQLEAYNPNKMPLSAREVTAKLVLDGKYDLGTVTIPHPVSLPAGGRVTLDVPVSIKWSDFAPLVTLAASDYDVPYEITGTVAIGGDKLNVDVPFTAHGTMTHAQIVQATMRSIPQLPGLQQLPGMQPLPGASALPGRPPPPTMR